jgi:uncharacterized RmlC-like cupin family protein
MITQMPNSMRYSLLLFASVLSAQTLVDNDQVRVLKVVDRPHVKTPPHEHKVNRVMIYLGPGKQEFVSAGKTTTQEWKAGQAVWSPASPTHTAEVVSEQPLPILEIELKKPANPAAKVASALDPLRADPKRCRLEFENPQVRVYRVRMGPKDTLAMHEHLVNKLAVFLTDVDETVTTADGKADHVTNHAGDVVFGGPVKHREQNLSDKPTDVIVVELKN